MKQYVTLTSCLPQLAREREPREDRTAGEWRRAMPRDSPVSSPRNDRFSSSDRFGHRDGRWSERGSFRDRGIDRPGDRNDRFERGGFDRPDQGDRGNVDRSDGSKTDIQWRGGGFGNKPGMTRERRGEERHGNGSIILHALTLTSFQHAHFGISNKGLQVCLHHRCVRSLNLNLGLSMFHLHLPNPLPLRRETDQIHLGMQSR